LLLEMFGEMPVSVQASTSSAGGGDVQADAVVLATLEFSRGRLAHVLQNRICRGETQYFEVRADTERASFRASFGGRARLSTGLFRSRTPHVRWEYGASGVAWREDGSQRRPFARNPADPNVFGTREVLQNALTAFAANTAPRCDAQSARRVMATVAACYLSAETGTRVRLEGPDLQQVEAVRMGEAAGATGR
jgi:predicted dehydrogenase